MEALSRLEVEDDLRQADGGGAAGGIPAAAARPTRQLRFKAGDTQHTLVADAAACVPDHTSELLYLSAAGSQTAVKSLRALLHVPKVSFEVWLASLGDYTQDQGIHGGQSFNKGKDGYEVWTHSLGYGVYHLVAKSRRPGFMPNLSAESVWQEIAGHRFTTPIVREWADYVMARMLELNLIRQAHCYGCDCGYMTADDRRLDQIVRKGILDGDIVIR